MANLSDTSPWLAKVHYLLTRTARTSNTILAAADKGKWFDITSGTFSQTFTAAATLGAGWWCYVGNSGTGEITLDPNASEQIDGLATYIMYPGEVRLVVCTGTAFETIILQGFRYAYTASGTWTKPPGYHSFDVERWGGGGSGAYAAAGGNASGGSGGGYWRDVIPAASLSATETVTIGAGGASQAASGNDGNVGANTTFAGVTAGRGNGGVQAAAGVAAAAAGGGSALDTYVTAAMAGLWNGGSSGAVSSGDVASAGGLSVFGGASGGSLGNTSGIAAVGTSVRGGAGGAANASGAGVAGTAPGGGGGASRGGASGAGARGEVRIVGVF